MMNQNKEYEDMPVKEKKKKQELREAGMDVNGEFSMDSLKKWFRRAGGALSFSPVSAFHCRPPKAFPLRSALLWNTTEAGMMGGRNREIPTIRFRENWKMCFSE